MQLRWSERHGSWLTILYEKRGAIAFSPTVSHPHYPKYSVFSPQFTVLVPNRGSGMSVESRERHVVFARWKCVQISGLLSSPFVTVGVPFIS